MGERPVVAVTVGDPSGIGPEVAVKAAGHARVRAVCTPRLYGPHTREALGAFPVGQVNAASGRAAVDAIREAVADVTAGRAAALATAPLNKTALAAAGLPWPGHTELLSELTGAPAVAMMFWSQPLRVVLATAHVPLAHVPARLTQERVETVIRLANDHLPRFGIDRPRIAVAGLNPHAGEAGLLGTEDRDVLAPAVETARAAGLSVTGPLPADTVFVRAVRGEFDVVVAAYHDQGLVPVKVLAFGKAVNVTLGLPIVRTSVDHGTAFDIAGKGVADEGSLVEAIVLAAELARGR